MFLTSVVYIQIHTTSLLIEVHHMKTRPQTMVKTILCCLAGHRNSFHKNYKENLWQRESLTKSSSGRVHQPLLNSRAHLSKVKSWSTPIALNHYNWWTDTPPWDPGTDYSRETKTYDPLKFGTHSLGLFPEKRNPASSLPVQSYCSRPARML